MCKSRTGNILPSSSYLCSSSVCSSSLCSYSFLSSFSFFSISRVVMGEGWTLLKVCDVTEWLPFVNINLSFVTMLCGPSNHKICFTCQYNLYPSIRRHTSIQRHIRRKILFLNHFNTHPSKSHETLYITLHEVFEDHILWELVNTYTFANMCSKSCTMVFVGLHTFEYFSSRFIYFSFNIRGNHS
jgi:hypothetical protein